MEVKAVGTDRKRAREWVDVPFRLYRNEPNWVPQLRKDSFRYLDPARSPLRGEAITEHFVLYDGGEPIGRVATTIQQAYIDKHREQVGFFGFLDAPADRAALGALTTAAEQWIRGHGLRTMAGPYNYWSGQEMGLLVHGFDEPPQVFQTWNPRGTLELLQELGFTIRVELAGYRFTVADITRFRDRLARYDRRFADNAALTCRSMTRRTMKRDLELVRTLFNRSFADNSEVIAYSREVFERTVLPIRGFLDPSMVVFVEHEGRPVGFMFIAPDLNRILHALGGRARLRDYPRVRRLSRSIDSAMVLIMGVVPDAPVGATSKLLVHSLDALRGSRYRSVQTTWVHESNLSFGRVIAHYLRSGAHKKWVLVEKAVAT
ncbi:hypothetical protein IU433_27870 [Nocardia puris]|uniref:N-acetyltransferase domain-containing protein n=1 Tax=Nocardia puris TaxID=208602 RepID=A0A366E342_9NOCA|nr:hypothetical protein [Nocardia puris]MBF6214408.1 hypothetical protein [Nocardia puris]MBF6369023.1 hypothetical protein [Nocardia puris]MBF6462829.1 hypothetical protein [Nocardia puris]RBO96790.1 hypothetical protein DFR74_101807 [Nocardia puris]